MSSVWKLNEFCRLSIIFYVVCWNSSSPLPTQRDAHTCNPPPSLETEIRKQFVLLYGNSTRRVHASVSLRDLGSIFCMFLSWLHVLFPGLLHGNWISPPRGETRKYLNCQAETFSSIHLFAWIAFMYFFHPLLKPFFHRFLPLHTQLCRLHPSVHLSLPHSVHPFQSKTEEKALGVLHCLIAFPNSAFNQSQFN